uniref:Disease resistance protein RGA3 n=1 Tax=Nelumbo nucifera TaxID=4432 RepID=A0A822YIP1_NELNU|nr:TPA_asm: hypothetical protein HUJ06_011301 [Nelumbo nucifera]
MAEAIASLISEKLTQFIQQEVELIVGVKEEAGKLFNALEIIKAVLKDAEERQLKEEPVKAWLRRLKDVAYDIDDLVDEWSTEVSKSEAQGDDNASMSVVRKVRSTISLYSHCLCFKQACLRHNFGHRIKDVNTRVDEILNEKDRFGFKIHNNTREEAISRPETRQTSSLIDISSTIGRDSEKELIVSKLLSEGKGSREERSFSVPIISIVGMGGLGKTTLAQLVFNDERITTAHFKNKIWVCVSEPFDKVRIAKEIVKAIDKEIQIDNDISWEALHNLLSNSLENRFYLLVLDDMWTEDEFDWEPLKLSLNRGIQGSRILVTTRKTKVAEMLGTTYLHNLEVLSDQDCWSLISSIALVGKTKEECEMLKGIGMEIAQKCKGLPLSVKSIGGLLRFKKPTKQDWQDVLSSSIWELDKIRQDVLPALLLSYYDLPSQLKQCFAYCAIFPKDYQIGKDQLIKLWMAQGFLEYSSSQRTLERRGEDYFDILSVRSFFQEFHTVREKTYWCKMHDLVHDFAQLLTERECYVLDIGNNITQEPRYKDARHITYIGNDDDDGNDLKEKTIPLSIYKAMKLRTLQLPQKVCEDYFDILSVRSFFQEFHTVGEKTYWCKMHDLVHDFAQLLTERECYVLDIGNNITQELRYKDARHITLIGNDDDDGNDLREKTIPLSIYKAMKLRTLQLPQKVCGFSGLIDKLTCLRALDLGGTCLKELPSKIEKLIHLRYLNLSDTELKELPETLSNLHNLQILELNYCSKLCKIPKGIGKLTKMRHLEIEGTESLHYLPRSIGRLSSLCTLSKFIIGGGGGECTIKELNDLKFLQGELEISGLGRVKSENEANVADLKNRENMSNLELRFDGHDGEDDNLKERKMETVLEGLQPHKNLKELTIYGYMGNKLASWMVRDDGLPNLRFLRLYACENLCKLPPSLGKLPFLEHLKIGGMDKIKHMDIHMFFGANQTGDGAKKAFPNLDILQIGGMKNLEDWDLGTGEFDGRETNSITFMQHLCDLMLSDCPKLKVLPPLIFYNKAALHIRDCPQLTWTPSSSGLLQYLHCLDLIGNAEAFLRSIPSDNKIDDLTIRFSPIKSLHNVFGKFHTLEELSIIRCEYIDSIPDELQHLSSLQKLYIYKCPLLEERGRKEVGEDWKNICHIPHIEINGRRIQ